MKNILIIEYEKYTNILEIELCFDIFFFKITSNKLTSLRLIFFFNILLIHASILQQNNNFTDTYVKNTNFVQHN